MYFTMKRMTVVEILRCESFSFFVPHIRWKARDSLPRESPMKAASLFPALQDFFAWLFLRHKFTTKIRKPNTQRKPEYILILYSYIIRTKVIWNHNTVRVSSSTRIKSIFFVTKLRPHLWSEHPGATFPLLSLLPFYVNGSLRQTKTPPILTPTIQLFSP